MKAITTKYLGPTNTHGARIAATDGDGNRVVVSYDYAMTRDTRHDEAARALCAKLGWTGRLMRGSVKGGCVYVWASDRDTLEV